MWRKVAYLLLAASFLLGLSAVTHAVALPTVVPVTIRVDSGGTPVGGVMIWLYGHAKDGIRLMASGVTDDAGMVRLQADLKVLATRYDPGTYIFESHAFKPGLGLTVRTWSVGADDLQSDQITEMTLPELCTSVSVRNGNTPASRYRTIETSPPRVFRDLVQVQQLHYVPGFNVTVKYTTDTSTTIQAGMKYTYPEEGDWSITGSVSLKLGSNTDLTWVTSTSRPYCQWLSTYFQFRESYWALQEEDGDIPDVWHTIQEWKEVTPLSHDGGNYYGPKISSGTCGTCQKDLDTVLEQPAIYGTAFEVFTPGSVGKTVTGSITTSWGFDGGIFGVTLSYAKNTKVSHEFSHSDPNSRYGAYDMRTGFIYYVTKKPK